MSAAPYPGLGVHKTTCKLNPCASSFTPEDEQRWCDCGVVKRDAASRAERDWDDRYYEAMQWRDWQECELLLDEREQSAWWNERDREEAAV